MNGDLGKIYKSINDVATEVAILKERQANQHLENKAKMGILDNIQCQAHGERLKSLSIGLRILYGITISVLLIWVKIALAK